jgi:hypothetical protein
LERSSRSESSFAIGKLYDAENLQQSADRTSAAHFCHENICFQSCFMLITVQPFALASS